MHPFPFPGHTVVLNKPKDWDVDKHGPCIGLPVRHDGGGIYVSFWKLTWRERFRVLFGAGIWMAMLTPIHPPVRLTVGPADAVDEA